MERHESTTVPPPVAALVATTGEATRSLGDRPNVRFATFPCRVGRERRGPTSARPKSADLRLAVAPQQNDIYLLEPYRKHLHVSREHFAIEFAANKFLLSDRGSACGTIVAGPHIGGDGTRRRTELRSDDEIVVGTDGSPYVFRFELATD